MSNDAAGERWRLRNVWATPSDRTVFDSQGDGEFVVNSVYAARLAAYLNALEQALAAANERAALADVKAKLLDDTFAMLRGSSEFMPLTIHRRYDALTAQAPA